MTQTIPIDGITTIDQTQVKHVIYEFALGLLASGPVLAWVLLRSIVWVAATIVLPGLAALAFLLG